MRNFFKWTIKFGLRIILIALIIWIIFFSLKYFFPESYNLIQARVSSEANSGGTDLPIRYKVYNFLFNNAKNVDFNGEETKDYKKDFYNQGATVWGENSSTTVHDRNTLNQTDDYLFLNSSDSQDVANNFRFDDELISSDEVNILNPTTTITGDISLNYLSTPYFTVDLYDKDGNYLYSLFGKGQISDEDGFMSIQIEQNLNWNYSRYSGEGFLVIWSDNSLVDGVLITKINIISNSTSSDETADNN